jgi:hypothetical protein
VLCARGWLESSHSGGNEATFCRLILAPRVDCSAGTPLASSNTMTFYLILIGIGLLIACAGNIWLIVAAFRESVAWGLCALFVPFAVLVFLFRHWDVAKQPFLCSLLGTILVATPLAMNWDEFSKHKEFAASIARIKGEPTPAPDQQARLEKMQTAFVQHAAELKAKYDVLQAQWARLSPKDKAGRVAFDQQAALYQTMRKQVETEKSAVEAPAATTK